jgi:DNA-directed RNA polymerase specialized sigma24 family protein
MLESTVVAGAAPGGWTLVRKAAEGDTPAARDALGALYETWRRPVYAFILRRGYRPEEAEDLTQEFFVRLIEKNVLGDARSERGAFGGFLLGCLRNFLANEWDRSQARKRGGGAAVVAIDDPERSREGEPVNRVTPDKLYETRCALGLLDRTWDLLRRESRERGQSQRFARFGPLLRGAQPCRTYAGVAGDLRLTETAVKVAVHRLRRRYGVLLREEMARAAGPGGDVEGEIRFLIRVVGAA